MKVSDELGILAKIAEMQAVRSEVSDLASLAAGSAEAAALNRDRYAARYYETQNARSVVLRTVDVFATAGDILVSTATGSSSWDTGGDGSLDIDNNDPFGSAELKVNIGAGTLLIDAVALATRLRCNVSPDLMDLIVAVNILDAGDNIIFPVARMTQISSVGETEFWQNQEELPKIAAAKRIQFLVAWQSNAGAASVDIQIADRGMFNDHSATLSSDEVVLARQKIFLKTASFTTVSGLSGSSMAGGMVTIRTSSSAIVCTLNDGAQYGDQIQFRLDITGSGTVDFIAEGTDAITKDFALTLAAADAYRIVTATYWDDGGTDTWNLSISAGDT
ncbi:hypothetical protein IIC65_01940 [Candidatus Sumerlaeota bacterium]|nr:hypothetical protein [Candidatus Sumerlaeota bacterium]